MIRMVSNTQMDKRTTLDEVTKMSSRTMRRLRESAGLNQRDLARKVGVSQPAICRWETGERDIPVWGAKLIAIATYVAA